MSSKIVFVGMGPIGCASACAIKALYKDVETAAFDHHELTEKRRNHGLNIRHDSVNEILAVLNRAILTPTLHTDIDSAKKLVNIFKNWSGSFVRTTKIEDDLTALATEMGVEVIRDKECKVTSDNLDGLLDTSQDKAKQTSEKLQRLFADATIIIGADGAKSTVRTVVMGNQLVDKETLRYLIELKYQTDGQVQPRGNFEASTEALATGHLSFESMSKNKTDSTKPVTLHLFIGKSTYDKLRIIDKNGNLKGVFGNSWTLKEIEELAKEDPLVKKVHDHFVHHLEGIQQRGGRCLDEQISTLEMNVYRSQECVKKYKGKYVFLVGDSESGIVLEGGFNKGLRGVAALAKVVETFLSKPHEDNDDELPIEFQGYAQRIAQIFKEEKRYAKGKNMALSAVETSLGSSVAVSEFSSDALETSYATSSSVVGGIFSIWPFSLLASSSSSE